MRSTKAEMQQAIQRKMPAAMTVTATLGRGIVTAREATTLPEPNIGNKGRESGISQELLVPEALASARSHKRRHGRLSYSRASAAMGSPQLTGRGNKTERCAASTLTIASYSGEPWTRHICMQSPPP